MAYIYYNPNPTERRVEDCSVRAVAKALDITWEEAFALLTKNAFLMSDMPHANSVIGSILRQHGYFRKSIPNSCPDCYTVENFLMDHPVGTFVLMSENHIATAQNGTLFDTWDSRGLVPQFYWYKKEE